MGAPRDLLWVAAVVHRVCRPLRGESGTGAGASRREDTGRPGQDLGPLGEPNSTSGNPECDLRPLSGAELGSGPSRMRSRAVQRTELEFGQARIASRAVWRLEAGCVPSGSSDSRSCSSRPTLRNARSGRQGGRTTGGGRQAVPRSCFCAGCTSAPCCPHRNLMRLEGKDRGGPAESGAPAFEADTERRHRSSVAVEGLLPRHPGPSLAPGGAGIPARPVPVTGRG